jgi:uncharacterized protein (DUF1697 family)
MAQLKAACEDAGLKNVSTYIASGNLVFQSKRPAAAVKGLIEDLLRESFGHTKNPAIIRTSDDLASAIAKNPFPALAASTPNALVVVFLGDALDAAAATRLSSYDAAGRLRADGHHLYIDYTSGMANAKFTLAPFSYLDKTLKIEYTGRNWNTTNKLLAMARTLEAAGFGRK